MLTIDCGPAASACDGIRRRDFLRAGILGIAGLTLGDWLKGQARADGGGFARDKSVVLLFLAGGPSQYETFDPKPDGIDSFRSIAGHIPTKLPGLRFASYFPKLAERADRLTVVRSMYTKTFVHGSAVKNLLTGGLNNPQDGEGTPVTRPSIGSVVARAYGAINPRTGMPSFAVVPPVFEPVAGFKVGSVNPGVESTMLGCQPGPLGANFRPFNPEASSGWKELVTIQDSELRLDGRRELLGQLDQLNRRIDASDVLDQHDRITQQAFETLRGGAIRRALDLGQEDPRVMAAYDTRHCPIYNWSSDNRWLKDGPTTGMPLGRQMLLARRLVEAGSRFVTVVHSNWDMHGGNAIWGMKDGMEIFAPPLDHAVAAFLDDIAARGLSDKILLVITGEFGRGGRINASGGREHNPRVSPLVLAGGGLKHGQLIGESGKNGERAERDLVSIEDFTATLMHYLFDVEKLRLDRTISAHLQALAVNHGQPIAGLM